MLRRAGWQSGHGRTKGGSTQRYIWPWMRHGMPVRMFVTAGTVVDCSQACRPVEGITADYLLADKGYDSDALVEAFTKDGIKPVIPPRKGRKSLRAYDTCIYRLRHPVQNAFLELKRWRALPHDMPKILLHSWRKSISGVLPFGIKSNSDSI